MKILIAISLCIVIVFMISCQQKMPSQPSSSNTAPAPTSSQVKQVNTDFHNCSYNSYQWLNNGTMVAVENNGNIIYLNLDNEVVKTCEIDKKYLQYYYNIKWNSDYMVVLNQTYFIKIDGQWKLCNFSVHNHDGSLIKEFSTLKYNEDDTSVTIDGTKFDTAKNPPSYVERLEWIDSNNVALYNNEYIFLVDITTGKIDMVADFSDIVEQHGHFGVYYGIQNIVVNSNEDIMYLANDIEEKSKPLGTFYYLKKSENYKNAIKGDTFENLYPYKGIAILQTYVSEKTGDTKETQLFYSIDGKVMPLATFDGYANPCGDINISNGKRILVEADNSGFWVYDIVDGKMAYSFNYDANTSIYDTELVTVYGEPDDLTFVFSNRSKKLSYTYHQGDSESTKLKNYIHMWNNAGFFVSHTHFIELNDDHDGLRIMRIE